MAMSETERVEELLKHLRQAESAFGANAERRVYDKAKRRFRPATEQDAPDEVIEVTEADMGWGA